MHWARMCLGEYETDRKHRLRNGWDTICVAAMPYELNKPNFNNCEG